MNHNHGQGMGKHMLLMLICCLVPIGLVLAVSVLGLSLGPLQPLIPYVAALMCPLMMGAMVYLMMRGNGSEPGQHHDQAQPTRSPNQLTAATPRVVEAGTGTGTDKCH